MASGDQEAGVLADSGSGVAMLREIHEQPERLTHAFRAGQEGLSHLRAALAKADHVALIGRGSSRAACSFGAWACRSLGSIAAFVPSPAELAWGTSTMPSGRSFVVAVSQSGESKELLDAVHRVTSDGASLAVITNTPESSLGRLGSRSGLMVDCAAGPEVAIPATKSFTSSLAVLLSLALSTDSGRLAHCATSVPSNLTEMLESPPPDLLLSERRAIIVTGEGAGAAIAEEGAIKLRETLGVPVTAMEMSEFLHGSINAAGADITVVNVVLDSLSHTLSRQIVAGAGRRGADVAVIGTRSHDDLAEHVPIPEAPAEVAAFAAAVRLQQLAWRSALAAGRDPDAPPGLDKVTEIRGRSTLGTDGEGTGGVGDHDAVE